MNQYKKINTWQTYQTPEETVHLVKDTMINPSKAPQSNVKLKQELEHKMTHQASPIYFSIAALYNHHLLNKHETMTKIKNM